MNHFSLMSEVFKKFPAGDFYRASAKNFPALKGIAVQALDLREGAIREPHVHPNANQLDYCIAGSARVGIVGPEGKTRIMELKKGDISFVPQGYLHWIENVGNAQLQFLVALSHEEPETIELSEMLGNIPRDTLSLMFGEKPEAFDFTKKGTVTIGGGNVF